VTTEIKMNASPELMYLVLSAGLTGLLWLPYMLNRITETGIWPTLATPKAEGPPKAKWAQRLISAHGNAVENLVVFAALVVALQLNQVSNEITAIAAMVFFYARLAHVVMYTLGIPVLRTLAFFVGFVCEGTLFVQFFS